MIAIHITFSTQGNAMRKILFFIVILFRFLVIKDDMIAPKKEIIQQTKKIPIPVWTMLFISGATILRITSMHREKPKVNLI